MTTEQTLKLAVESLARVNEAQSRQLEVQSHQLEILTGQNEELSQRIKELTAQIAWFQRQMFGRKSERHLGFEGQPSLFGADELGSPAPDAQDEDEPHVVPSDGTSAASSKRKSVKRPRQTWDNLPVLETRVIEPQGHTSWMHRRRNW